MIIERRIPHEQYVPPQNPKQEECTDVTYFHRDGEVKVTYNDIPDSIAEELLVERANPTEGEIFEAESSFVKYDGGVIDLNCPAINFPYQDVSREDACNTAVTARPDIEDIIMTGKVCPAPGMTLDLLLPFIFGLTMYRFKKVPSRHR